MCRGDYDCDDKATCDMEKHTCHCNDRYDGNGIFCAGKCCVNWLKSQDLILRTLEIIIIYILRVNLQEGVQKHGGPPNMEQTERVVNSIN